MSATAGLITSQNLTGVLCSHGTCCEYLCLALFSRDELQEDLAASGGWIRLRERSSLAPATFVDPLLNKSTRVRVVDTQLGDLSSATLSFVRESYNLHATHH